LRSGIAAGRYDWPTVIEIANAQLMTPALWVGLTEKGLVENLPRGVRDYLRELHRLNILRNERLRVQVLEAVRGLNSMGIEPILLKGSGSLFVKTFTDPGSRVMMDLDILVPQADAEACWRYLLALGYAPLEGGSVGRDAGLHGVDYSRHHHLRPLYRPGDYGTLEIHRHVLPEEMAGFFPSQSLWNNIEPLEEDGTVMAVPAPTYRILHNLIHAALVDRGYLRGELPLRSLHEMALMLDARGEPIDWTTIRQLLERGGEPQVLGIWLYLCHRLFGSPLPNGFVRTPATITHYARARLQARWNYLDKLVDRALWFSAADIRERYQCDGGFASLAKGRVRLAAHISRKNAGRAFRWVGRQLGGGQGPGGSWR
jgi:hypothetical protein